MSKRRRDSLEDRKMVMLMVICFVIFIIASIFFFNMNKREKEKEENITRLTDEYNKNHSTKTRNITWENTMPIEEEVKESEEEEEEEEEQGVYKIADIEKLDDSNAKREAEDFALFLSEKINEKSFDEIYSIFNNEYKEDFKYTEDKFISEYTYSMGIETEVTNVKLPNTKDRLIVTIKLIDKASNAFKIKDFTVFSNGTIADIAIYLSVELPHEREIDNVIYKITKRYDTRLGAIYIVEIENNSDKLIKIEDMFIKNHGVVYSYEIISDNTILEAYPGIPFQFMMKLPNNRNIDYLVLKCIDFKGNLYEVTILGDN